MVLPLIAALGGGSGIASLLGGFFGRKKAKAAPGVDYLQLRKDAEKGGFNPLTALMAGGGSGYQRDFAPALSSGQFIADAIGRVVDTGFNRAGGDDPQAKSLIALDRFKAVEHSARVRRVPGRFGFALTDAVVQRPVVHGGFRGNTGAAADPVSIMVPTKDSSGFVRLGPNPDGADLDTAAYAILADAYSRRQNSTFGRPLTSRDVGAYSPHRPDRLPPSVNPWALASGLIKKPGANRKRYVVDPNASRIRAADPFAKLR